MSIEDIIAFLESTELNFKRFYLYFTENFFSFWTNFRYRYYYSGFFFILNNS